MDEAALPLQLKYPAVGEAVGVSSKPKHTEIAVRNASVGTERVDAGVISISLFPHFSISYVHCLEASLICFGTLRDL